MDALLDDDGVETRLVAAPAGLYLSRRGAWYHDGDRVKHAGLEGLLHRSIARDAAGKLLVTTGRDRVPFVAEDAPFFVRTIAHAALVLSDETREDLARAFFVDDLGRIRCPVKGGVFWALLSRSATQGLTALLDDDGRIPAPGGARALTSITHGAVRDWSAACDAPGALLST